MNSHQEINELLPAYVLGELDGLQATQVREHLAECTQCQEEVQRIQALLLQTEQLRGQSVDEEMCQSAGRKVLSATETETVQRPQRGSESPVALIWRIVMKNGFTKVAVAAAVILAAFLGLRLFTGDGSGRLYANVVEILHNARTLTYSMVTKTGGDRIQTIRVDIAFKEPNRLRIATTGGYITVLDSTPGKAKGISLVPDTKSYVIFEMSNMPDDPGKDPWVTVERLRTIPDRAEEALGRHRIDGLTLEGFRAREGDTTTTVWIDPKTGNLIRAEMEYANAPGMNMILTDFQVDVPLDDSLFSLNPPEGFQPVQVQADLSTVTERDFIEYLRLWSTWTVDGTFPPVVNGAEIARIAVQMGREGKFRGPYAPGYEPGQQRNIMFRGMSFMGTLPSGTWRYAGQNVSFGDGQTPIFWYQPQGSATYRVIYADLSVKDVSPEALPR